MVHEDKYKKANEIFGEKLECDEEIRFFGRICCENKKVEKSANYWFRIAIRFFFGGWAVISAVWAWSFFWSSLKEDFTVFNLVDMTSEKLIFILLAVFIAALFVLILVSNRKSHFPLIITDRRVLYKETDGYQSVYYKNIKTHVLHNNITRKSIEIVCFQDDDEKNNTYSEYTSITDYAYYMAFGDLDKKHKKKSEQDVTKCFELGKGTKEAYKVFKEALEPYMSARGICVQDECGVTYESTDDYLRRKQINMEANGEQVLWTDKQTQKMDKRILLGAIISIPIYCALSFTKAIIPTLRDISQISGEGAAFAIGVCIYEIISWLFSIFVVFMIFRLMLSTMETVVILTNRRIIEFGHVKYTFTHKSIERYIEFSNINSYYLTGYESGGEWLKPLMIRGYVTEVKKEKKNKKGYISISHHHAEAVKEMLAEAIENAKKNDLQTES